MEDQFYYFNAGKLDIKKDINLILGLSYEDENVFQIIDGYSFDSTRMKFKPIYIVSLNLLIVANIYKEIGDEAKFSKPTCEMEEILDFKTIFYRDQDKNEKADLFEIFGGAPRICLENLKSRGLNEAKNNLF